MANTKSKDSMPLVKIYIWLLSYMKPYAWLVASLIVSILVISLTELFVPRIIGVFIDDVLPGQNTSLFVLLLFAICGLVILRMIFMIVRNSSEKLVREKASSHLQYSMLAHLRKLGLRYYEQQSGGETLSLLNNEVKQVQELYRTHFPASITQIIFTLCAFVMISTFAPKND